MANSAVVGILRALLTASTAEFETAIKRSADTMKVFSRDAKAMGAQATQVGAGLTKALTVPLAGIGISAAKAYIDFESSFAGVAKTVGGLTDQSGKMTAIGEQMAMAFRGLSKEIPVNVNEINRLGEAAGALGIPKEEVVEFARVMAELGVTTNLTSEQAATGIAKIQNIFGAAGQETERLASTLVALGNAGASTETEILEMGQRIAGAGHTVGLSQAQVLSFASTLASVGINAEAGGSAISRIFLKINDAVASGGESLNEFARVAGRSSEEFKHLFGTDAAAATQLFIAGLGRLKAEGANVNATIEGLVGKNIILKDTLLRLSGAGDLLNTQLRLGADAWKANTALTDEARVRFQTTSSQLTVLWNRIKDVGITLGGALNPAIHATIRLFDQLLPVVETAVKGFAALPEPIQMAAVGLLAAAAAAGPMLLLFGQISTAFGAVTGAFAKSGLATRALTGLFAEGGMAVGLFGRALSVLTGPIGWIVGIGSAVLSATSTWDEFFRVLKAGASIIGTVVVQYFDRFVAAGKAIGGAIGAMAAFVDDIFKISDSMKMLGRAIQIGMGWAADGMEWVADAIAKMPSLDAMTKNIGPAAKAMAEPLRVISADTAEAIDRVSRSGNTLATMNQTLAGSLGDAKDELAKLSSAARGDLTRALQSGAFTMKELEDATGLSAMALKLFKEQVESAGKKTEAATEANKKFRDSVTNLTSSSIGATQGFGAFGRLMPDLSAQTIRLADKTVVLDSAIDATKTSVEGLQREGRINSAALAGMGVTFGTLPGLVDPASTSVAVFRDELSEVKTVGQSVTEALQTSLGRIPDILKQAFTGGGNLIGGLKAILIDFASQMGTLIAGQLGRSLAGAFSGAGGAMGGGVGLGEQAASMGVGVAGSGIAGALMGGGSAAAGGAAATGIGVSLATAGITLGISAAVIGGIMLAKKLYKAEWEKLGADIGRDMGVKISEQLAKAMEADSKKYGRQVAMSLHLDDIIGEAGGLSASNVNAMTQRLRDVFSFIETGQISIAQGAKVIDDNWSSFVAAGTDKFGFLNEQLREIITLNDRFGTQSKEIAAYLQQQSDIAISGANSAIAALGPQIAGWQSLAEEIATAKKEGRDYADLTARQTALVSAHRGQLETLGVVALGVFNAAIANGKSYAEALAAAGPGLSQLKLGFDALGLSIDNAALKSLALQASVIEKNPTLIAGVNGLSQAFVALSNTHQLTGETFTAMQQTGVQMYSRIQGEVAAMGGSTKDALMLMQDYLHRAEKAAFDLKVPLDDNTQILIDQSKELGIWKDTGETAAEKNEKAQERVYTAMERVALMLERIANFIVPDKTFTVTAQHRNEGAEPPDGTGWDGGDSGPEGYAATGALVTSRGLSYFGGGGVAGMNWTPKGADVIPAMVAPGELIMNDGQQDVVGYLAARGLQQGAMDNSDSGLGGRVQALQSALEGIAQRQHTAIMRLPDMVAQAVRDTRKYAPAEAR